MSGGLSAARSRYSFAQYGTEPRTSPYSIFSVVYPFPFSAFVQFLHLADKPCADYRAIRYGNSYSFYFPSDRFKDIQICPLPIGEFPNFKRFSNAILGDIEPCKPAGNVAFALYRLFPMTQDIFVKGHLSAVRRIHFKPLFEAFFFIRNSYEIFLYGRL